MSSAFWTDLAGSVLGYIRLGITGVRLKNSSGTLSVRNAGDSADAPVTASTFNGLTPTAQSVGFTLSGGTTLKTLTVALDASVSGTNTGDQDLSGYADIGMVIAIINNTPFI